MKITKKLKATAYHEAGHCVAASSFGLSIESVSIHSDAGSYGRLKGKEWFKWNAVQPARIAKNRLIAIVSLAGPEAETKFLGRRNKTGALDDEFKCYKYAHDLTRSPTQAKALFSYFQICAKELFTTHLGNDTKWWPCVERVAEGLLEKGLLDQKQVISLMYSPVLNKPVSLKN